jgi:hypothetical protein
MRRKPDWRTHRDGYVLFTYKFIIRWIVFTVIIRL